jgi:probable F420-dependent oxidoreductase
MDIRKFGLWTVALDLQPAPAARDAAAEIESLGWGAIWIPEAVNREVMSNSMLLLGATERIVVATGIANLHARAAMAMAAGHKTVTAAHPDRFLLGIGVSHQVAVEGFYKQTYDKPLTTMRQYLDAMDSALFFAAPPPVEPTRVLAALGPKMLELARDRAAGAHPYFVPVEHTPVAREILGAGKLLCPEQAVVLESDPETARRIARMHMQTYLGLPNYTNNLKRLGWTDEDIANGGTDALVDAIVAWGSTDDVVKRLTAHHDAGADHVAIQVLTEDPRALPMPQWRELAGALDLTS